MAAVRQLSAGLCRELQLPKIVCDARTRLEKSSDEIKKEVVAIVKVGESRKKTYEEFFSAAKNSESRAAALTKAETKEFSDSIALNTEPDWSKFSNDRKILAKGLWADYKKLKAQWDEINEKPPELEKFKQRGYYNDLLTVQSCLFESAPTAPESQTSEDLAASLKYFREVQATFPQRQFSERDVENAKQCESSIHF